MQMQHNQTKPTGAGGWWRSASSNPTSFFMHPPKRLKRCWKKKHVEIPHKSGDV
jgi:hypothetical protein